MGSLFKPKVSALPAAPAEPSYDNFVDNTTGVTRTRVKNPDGTYTIVQDQNLTPEQQALQDKIKGIASQNLSRYNELAKNYDISAIPGLSDAVTAARQSAQAATDAGMRASGRAMENQLSQYGIKGSTAASEARGQLAGQYAAQTASNNWNSYNLEQQVRQQEMGNAMNGYNLAQGALNNQQAQQAGSFAAGANTQNYLAGLSQQRNMANYQGQLSYMQAQNQANAANSAAWGSLAGLGASALTGGIGGGMGALGSGGSFLGGFGTGLGNWAGGFGQLSKTK